MSKSIKKTPIWTDTVIKKSKKFANRKIRRLKNEEFGNGNNYKKYYESYDIHDYKERLFGKIEEWWKKIGK